MIDQGLAACGHRQTIESTYTWQGDIHRATETRVSIHTRIALFDRIAALAKERHPYDVPCIIALPITHASVGYTAWVRRSTTAKD
ncbi:MAG: divalent-cation tolerance protein CutA [Micropruina sp.]|nr:divalent-cation tolerance protein CutA [Micropruina sp.]